MPHLTDHVLRQMDEAWLENLAEPVARGVLSLVVEDLKEARDRLNQNSENSSWPPGSRLPWEDRRLAEAEEDGEATGCAEPRSSSVLPAGEAAADGTSRADEASPGVRVKAPSGRKPGERPGAEGYGRTQKLVVDEVEHRHPAVCAACGAVLAAGAAYTGWDTIDVLPLAEGEVGLGVSPVTVSGTGTLKGSNGVFLGPVTIAAGGTLAPGASIGTLFVSNNVSLGGRYVMEVNLSTSTNDMVVGISNLTYTLESSTNFVDWQTLLTAPAPLWFADSPTNARRFYRLTR